MSVQLSSWFVSEGIGGLSCKHSAVRFFLPHRSLPASCKMRQRNFRFSLFPVLPFLCFFFFFFCNRKFVWVRFCFLMILCCIYNLENWAFVLGIWSKTLTNYMTIRSWRNVFEIWYFCLGFEWTLGWWLNFFVLSIWPYNGGGVWNHEVVRESGL